MPPANIILLHSDQHRYDCVGVNGHPLLRTPNLDALASQGVRFTHAFTVAPVCVPARTSLLTGTWPSRHLAIANPGTEAPRPMRQGLPTFSQVLSAAGYHLGFVGTWQIDAAASPLQYGFHDYISEHEYDTWRCRQGLPPEPHGNGWFGECDPHVAPDQTRLGWGAERFIELMQRYVESGGPFFLRWDPHEPHLPNILPEPYCSMYRPTDIAPWPSFPDPLVGKPYIQAQQRRTWKVDGWSWEDWAPFVARYLGEISLLDAQVGRILAAVRDLGIEDNTLVVYTADHGDMCGGHGMIDKHFVMYDDVVRVPLVARYPGGGIVGGRVNDAFVASSIDLPATFCDVAGLDAPPTFQGQSLLPLLRGQAQGRDGAFAVYFGSQFGLYSQRMLRDRRWKYVWNATAEDELYDLQADPGERINLATLPACAPELARLRSRLVEWMSETEDPLLNIWTREQLLQSLKA